MGTNYKNFIDKQVDIKSSEIRSRIQGILVAVYSDVLIIQGLTCWGVRDKDIQDFKVINEQPNLFEKRAVV